MPEIEEQASAEAQAETTIEAQDVSSEITSMDDLDENTEIVMKNNSEASEEADSTENTEEQENTTSTEENTEDDGTSTEDSSTTNNDESTTSAEATSENNTEDEDESLVYTQLSEETGVAVTSDDDIVEVLKELSEYRSGKKSDLSPAIQAAIEMEKAGGNLADHFARVGMDVDKMDTKEVLRQNFFRKNAKLHNDDPKFAQAKFERDFKDDYGLLEKYNALSESEKEDFVDEHGQDNINYEKMKLDSNVREAKEELEGWKKEASPVAKPENGVFTEDEATEFADKYKETAKATFGDFEAVTIPLGEGQEAFQLGLNGDTKPTVEQWIMNPATFLEDIGFEGKKIDTEILLPIMALVAEASNGTLGGRIADHVVNSDNIDTIKNKIQKPNSTATAIPQDRTGSDDPWEKVAEAAEKARGERQ